MQQYTWQHCTCKLCWPLGEAKSMTFKSSDFLVAGSKECGVLSVVSHHRTLLNTAAVTECCKLKRVLSQSLIFVGKVCEM
jgi:hypothetical protein